MQREPIDPRLVRALAHPLRVRILDILTERVASPNALADELDVGLTHVAYHTRTLQRCGCLDMVDTAQKRGATEHFYKASPGSFVGDPDWRRVPLPVRGGVSTASLRTFVEKAGRALKAGTIDAREDTVFRWNPLLLDQRGWDEVTAILREAGDRILAAQKRSRARLARARAGGEPISAVFALANFETAGPRGRLDD
jgi:DNA-binding transcriptional ArsR family regulator